MIAITKFWEAFFTLQPKLFFGAEFIKWKFLWRGFSKFLTVRAVFQRDREVTIIRITLRGKCPFRSFSGPYRENKDQKNAEYEHVLRSVRVGLFVIEALSFLLWTLKWSCTKIDWCSIEGNLCTKDFPKYSSKKLFTCK